MEVFCDGGISESDSCPGVYLLRAWSTEREIE